MQARKQKPTTDKRIQTSENKTTKLYVQQSKIHTHQNRLQEEHLYDKALGKLILRTNANIASHHNIQSPRVQLKVMECAQ